MKTNVSIKFNSIEEYREIEKKLEELGYFVGELEKSLTFNSLNIKKEYSVYIHNSKFSEVIININGCIVYNSLEEFLKD